MKTILVVALACATAWAAPNKPVKTQPISKAETTVKKDQENKELNTLDKKPEDCDDKAKKPVEITPESISLSGGTAGCTLDEAKP